MNDEADRGAIDRTTDEAAIRSLLAANWTAGNAHDAEGVAATYLPDGDAWIAGLSRVSGRDEIRRAEEEFGAWDIQPDGDRFLAVEQSAGLTEIRIVENCFSELERLVLRD